jgi:hypothetical protein
MALGAVVNYTIVLAHSYKTELLLLLAIMKITGIKTDFIPESDLINFLSISITIN